ncbi:hypothetical protein GDO81_020697 [Engystomops pustulosus]|uniref:Uncharacterized protein n=1 Tax=Engystomops pustulosus TaxID=76066 RepID=A0AAV6Z7T4_ENGPU|nr:hypothetical protein GDO81_020697 [Engystomops pustulosus]
MAERDAERKVRIYRSVSFRKLGNWNAKAFSEEGGTELPGKGDVTQPTCQKTHRPPARSLSLTRKVSKISSANKDQNSPSVRQLSQRFSPQQRDDGAVSDDENLRRVDLPLQAASWEGNSIAEPSQGSQQDFINPSGSDGLSLALPGKSHDFYSPSPRESPSSGISLDEVNTFCSFLQQPDNRDLFVTEGTNWPSVTEMRKLFGESTRKVPSRASSLPDCEEPRLPGQPGSHIRESSGMEPQRHCLVETATAKGFNHYTKEQTSGPAQWPKNATSRAESNYCRALLESKTDQQTVCLDTKEHRIINTGPKPQPPPPPPRSCIPFGLKAHTLSSGLPKQEARQQSLSLHSWHSSGKPQTAPNNVRLKDSYSVEELQRNTLLPTLAHKNSSKITPQEASSGSDEEGELDVLRECLRKRTARKEKDLVFDNKDSDGGGHNILVNSASDMGQGTNLSDFSVQTNDTQFTKSQSGLVSVRSDASSLASSPSANSASTTPHETSKHFRNPSETTTPGQLASASPMPTVSRVAKVNIPPFMPSPCGSRSSSRYSSTETLKDDDHFHTHYAGQARSLQGGFIVHRSPSFGQHESTSRPIVRPRSKITSSTAKLRNDNVNHGLHFDLESEDSKQKISMSNPDIASDTLSLLSYIKSDISDLKLKNRGQGTSNKENLCCRPEDCQESSGQQSLADRSRPMGQNRLQQGGRPTLKDLTATLRRTKSFTYSDKLGSRRISTHSSMKQSSSELMLATASSSDGIFSHVEAANNVEENYDEPVTMQDQYIQEARQVFEKIKQIGSQDDYNFDQEVIEHLKSEKCLNTSPDEVSDGKCMKKSASDEIISSRKTSDLSGAESSLTDEGIVTEVDPAPCTLYRDLGQKLKVWKSSGTSQEESEFLHPQNGDSHTSHSESTHYSDTQNMTNSQGPMDAPPTPGTVRRRRKFPSLGNSGTDSSSGSNGESGSETYRSLSDPMPHRRYSITEDAKKFSMDSNLLGSLNSKSGISDSSATVLSECTGSAASVLSFSSDGVKDYNTVIQNIVSQPGALDKVIDEKGNGKTIKKKSFSDPSRRGELSPAGLEDSNEPSKELEQSILASTSEPILSEQRDELEDLDEIEEETKFQPEHPSPADLEENGLEGNQSLSFDPNLVNVLSPRVVRRSFKKRSSRIGSHDSNREGEEPKEAIAKIKQGSKHVRHTSEPATFIPISPPECKVLGHGGVHLPNLEPARPHIKQYPVVISPLEDVSKQAPVNIGNSNSFNPMDLPRTAPSTPTTSEPKPLRVPRPLEEAGNRSKPNVVSASHC